MNFYDSIIDAAYKYKLTVQERGQLYTAALEYLHFDGMEPQFAMSKVPGMVFESMRPVFDKQLARQKAGANGGKTKARNAANAKQSSGKAPTKTPSKPLANDLANVKQNPTEHEQEQELEEELPNGSSKKPRPRFAPPTPEEVSAYASERGYEAFDSEHFCDYYAAQGWKLSNGNPMRDWKAAVRRWERTERPRREKEGDAYHGEYD